MFLCSLFSLLSLLFSRSRARIVLDLIEEYVIGGAERRREGEREIEREREKEREGKRVLLHSYALTKSALPPCVHMVVLSLPGLFPFFTRSLHQVRPRT